MNERWSTVTTLSSAETSGLTRRQMWHITVTVAGGELDEAEVKAALDRLADRHQSLLTARYGSDRAELQYWDEGLDVRSAAARALVLWNDYSEIAVLPPWDVVGLEVVDQPTFQTRSLSLGAASPGEAAAGAASPVGSGSIKPF